MSNYLGGIYVAYKESKSVGITSTIAAACNLIVDLSLIRFIGLYAASGSTLVSYVFLFFYRSVDVQKIVNVKYKKLHIAIVLVVILIESAICYMQKKGLNILNGILGIVVFIMLNHRLIVTVWGMLKKRSLKKRT